MKKNKKIIITIIIVILLIVIGIISIVMKHSLNKTYNVNHISEEKHMADLKITNISIEKAEGNYIFNAEISNISDSYFFGGTANLDFKDESGEIIGNYLVWIPNISNGEKITINTEVSEEVFQAKDVSIDDYRNR